MKMYHFSNENRFFKSRNLTYELVGTKITDKGWMHTIKLPYSKLETNSRYIEITDEELEKLKQ